MKEYSYHGFIKVLLTIREIFGALGIAVFTSFAFLLGIVGYSFKPDMAHYNFLEDTMSAYLCFGLWTLILGWIIGSSLINVQPTIWVMDEGINITAFHFWKIFIPWSQIVDIGNGHPPKGYTLVRTRKITIFHLIIGWLYSATFYPSFLIGDRISEKEKLIMEIRHGIALNYQAGKKT